VKRLLAAAFQRLEARQLRKREKVEVEGVEPGIDNPSAQMSAPSTAAGGRAEATLAFDLLFGHTAGGAEAAQRQAPGDVQGQFPLV